MTTALEKTRSVLRVVSATRTIEGAGFVVRRPFPTRALSDFDPFLLLDHMGPVNLAPGEAKGAPDHPHRGFETVSYILEGSLAHKDSQGNAGKLGPGDVQWMTAGAGVVHSEMPDEDFIRQGGRLHGFQLWVNLPRQDKMIRPRYQDIPAARIPVAQNAEGTVAVRVIAGEAMGTQAVIDTRTPIMYLHYTLQPGASTVQAVPPGYNAFVYVIDGEADLGDGRAIKEGQMALLGQDGNAIRLAAAGASTAPVNLLLIAGVPLNEPIVRYGPFVMNTEAEIYQAIDDYNNGLMGKIDF